MRYWGLLLAGLFFVGGCDELKGKSTASPEAEEPASGGSWFCGKKAQKYRECYPFKKKRTCDGGCFKQKKAWCFVYKIWCDADAARADPLNPGCLANSCTPSKKECDEWQRERSSATERNCAINLCLEKNPAELPTEKEWSWKQTWGGTQECMSAGAR